MSAYYELYRRSSCGLALTDALDGLIADGRMTPQLAMRILSHFDQAMSDALEKQVRARLNFKGNCTTYRLCDEVWTFVLRDASFRMENDTVTTDKIKIVACSSKAPT